MEAVWGRLRVSFVTSPRQDCPSLCRRGPELRWRLGDTEGRQSIWEGWEKLDQNLSSPVWFLWSRSPRKFEGAKWGACGTASPGQEAWQAHSFCSLRRPQPPPRAYCPRALQPMGSTGLVGGLVTPGHLGLLATPELCAASALSSHPEHGPCDD